MLRRCYVCREHVADVGLESEWKWRPVTGACACRLQQVRGCKLTEAAAGIAEYSQCRGPGHEQIEVPRSGSASTMGAAVELAPILCACSGPLAQPEISDAVIQLLPYYAQLTMGKLRRVKWRVGAQFKRG